MLWVRLRILCGTLGTRSVGTEPAWTTISQLHQHSENNWSPGPNLRLGPQGYKLSIHVPCPHQLVIVQCFICRQSTRCGLIIVTGKCQQKDRSWVPGNPYSFLEDNMHFIKTKFFWVCFISISHQRPTWKFFIFRLYPTPEPISVLMRQGINPVSDVCLASHVHHCRGT